MKAVGYKKSLPVDAADSLIDFETAKPEPTGRDIRVAVKAISANPVDYKVRKRAAPPEGETKILSYDAAGIVAGLEERDIGSDGVDDASGVVAQNLGFTFRRRGAFADLVIDRIG